MRTVLLLFAAEFFADDVGDASADQCGGGGPMVQAEDDACDGGGYSGDFDDHADVFEMRVAGHMRFLL